MQQTTAAGDYPKDRGCSDRRDLELRKGFSTIDFRKLDLNERLVYVEKRLVSKELAKSDQEVGLLLSNDEQISIMINEEDHLRIQCLASGMQLEKASEICNYIDNLLSQKINLHLTIPLDI